MPVISVVTPVFNAARYLPDTLKSIQAQDYPHIEWIVIDGASTDGTTDFLHANAKLIDYWLSEPDRGLYDAVAKGFEKANGDIVCWLGAGDIFLPGALAIVAEIFQKYPAENWITGMNFVHLPGGAIIRCAIPMSYRRDLIRCGAYGKSLPHIQQESTFFRRSMLDTADMEHFRRFKVAGDLYLWSCFAKQNRLKVVCAGLGSFCVHEGQLSENKDLYRREAASFLERMTLGLWIKMLVRIPLQHAPRIIKKMLSGDGMLMWTRGSGWE